MGVHVPRRATTAVLAALCLCACSGGTEGGGVGSAGSCGLTARFDGRLYDGNGGFRQLPTYGEPLGSATVLQCEDEEGFSIEAVAIQGIDPAIAFASPRYEDVVFVVEGTRSLPTELVPLRSEPACDPVDEPIELRGPWLGILEPDGTTEVDMVPPYDLSMRVEEASTPRYEQSFLTIHVVTDLEPPLDLDDARQALLEGGSLEVTASCSEGGFKAERLRASAPPEG